MLNQTFVSSIKLNRPALVPRFAPDQFGGLTARARLIATEFT